MLGLLYNNKMNKIAIWKLSIAFTGSLLLLSNSLVGQHIFVGTVLLGHNQGGYKGSKQIELPGIGHQNVDCNITSNASAIHFKDEENNKTIELSDASVLSQNGLQLYVDQEQNDWMLTDGYHAFSLTSYLTNYVQEQSRPSLQRFSLDKLDYSNLLAEKAALESYKSNNNNSEKSIRNLFESIAADRRISQVNNKIMSALEDLNFEGHRLENARLLTNQIESLVVGEVHQLGSALLTNGSLVLLLTSMPANDYAGYITKPLGRLNIVVLSKTVVSGITEFFERLQQQDH
jgi:hypothetical protein